MEGRLLLDVVVGQRAPILKLLAGEDQPLLVRGYPGGNSVSTDSIRRNCCTHPSLS
jgi:hypothetical protein